MSIHGKEFDEQLARTQAAFAKYYDDAAYVAQQNEIPNPRPSRVPTKSKHSRRAEQTPNSSSKKSVAARKFRS